MTDSRPSIGPGAYVDPEVDFESGVVVGPNATVLASDEPGLDTAVAEEVTIGANATILPGVKIGFQADIRPGAVVTRSVPARAIVEGNPAEIVGYVGTDAVVPDVRAREARATTATHSRVPGVRLLSLRTASDLRGLLAVAEIAQDIPFAPARLFMVHDVPSAETRGEHAHKQCQQLLIAVSGSIRVVADDGVAREEFLLDRPSRALYLPAMTWAIQFGYSPGSVLLALASDPYDPDDYIRDYGEFLRLAEAAREADGSA